MAVSTSAETSWKEPGFLHAFITLAAIIGVISVGLFVLETSLHSLILLSLMIASISAFALGYDFRAIRGAMNAGISGALTAVYIFILIGVLIAAFIQSGTLATLIYYGIEFVSPALFLPAGLLLCSLMSLATGTSWGTVGTMGVVLMGIGTSMGIPAPLVAGMVISGACFGDKMSPVSDTTNLAAMTSRVDLYSHIQSMLFTTGPAYLLALVIFSLMGLGYAENPLPAEQLFAMQAALKDTFTINGLTLLPLIVMLLLSMARVAAEPSMMVASSVAVVLAIVLQDQSLPTVLNSLYGGGTVATGLESLDALLGRGGITSMMWTLSLSLMALALGGILERCRFLRVLIQTIVIKITRASTLVATTVIACFTGNLTMGEAYISIILGGQLFSEAYDQKGVDRRVLSRSLEEGATLTTALIPWTTGGAFFASTLGVAVIEYAPWALLNWLSPVLAVVLAMVGFGLFRKGQDLQQTSPAV
ncbi:MULTISPECIES: Na+/H+ antiporter NhaC [unclassified Endozoicomonas]|uniref:Na+/H+ antiporter NhaC n=1 Tax=unclassified Endozoicomonas TaxID=2644528 RepID=UPI003BB52DDB